MPTRILTPRKPFICLSLSLLLLSLLPFSTGCRTQEPSYDWVNQELFLSRLATMRHREFDGQVNDAYTPNNPFEGQPLVIYVEEATKDGARIAMRVGDDHSRTWVFTRAERGRLHLRHDHRDPDGTPHELTDYGGYAAPGGTPGRQSFPADDATAAMLPEASTNIWTIEIEPSERFTYELTRHGKPRFRADFDLRAAMP
jgi:hypothetical protein